ncbi:MAG: hypothetical protein OEV57_06085, partial [Dehalococcoidia bacterium]|nr:hypothetical protein [Dehalococcoidia bacterium]
MRAILSSRVFHYVFRVSLLLIAIALVAGTVSCNGGDGVIEYDLTISSGTGGSVTTPGEGTFSYNAST